MTGMLLGQSSPRGLDPGGDDGAVTEIKLGDQADSRRVGMQPEHGEALRRAVGQRFDHRSESGVSTGWRNGWRSAFGSTAATATWSARTCCASMG